MNTIRLTAAQALVRYICSQLNEEGEPFIAGCWAIFGHGNVAGLGEALHAAGDDLPTWRGHNEQTMAHAAIAYAKAKFRRRAMAVTTSIGPGATNVVTAAALAHVNRIPLLILPGDVFAGRAPDPVLQQVESFQDGTVSANDCFRPVSRYYDRITRPEQLITALPRAFSTMLGPADCGPVTLSLCQDVQAEAFDWPEAFFEQRIWHNHRPPPDANQLSQAAGLLQTAKCPVIIAGGGSLYSPEGPAQLRQFAETHSIPVAETQAGKSVLPHEHPLNMGAIGVTGTAPANILTNQADLVLAVGTRLQDFTTGSWSVFQNPDVKIVGLNIASYDAHKHHSVPLIADAGEGLKALSQAVSSYASPKEWIAHGTQLKSDWQQTAATFTNAPQTNQLPSDAQVLGALQRKVDDNTIVVCAAGSLPAELHKLWQATFPGSYHLEYGFSCMGYEIAGGLGVKMARPDTEVVVTVGDGSYMMGNSELATAVMLGQKIILVVLDNRGFGCINRLQMATGGESFNNLLDTARHKTPSRIDFAAHAAAMGATSEKVNSIAELEQAFERARAADNPYAIVIDTDPMPTTAAGGAWWEVGVPEVSSRAEVIKAHTRFEQGREKQRRI